MVDQKCPLNLRAPLIFLLFHHNYVGTMMHQQQNTNPPAGGTGALRRLPRHQIQRRHSSFSDTTDKYFAASDESVSLTWSSKVKKSSKNNVPIEYWLSSAGLWINTAQLSLGKSKLFIEIPSEDPNRR